MSAAYYLQKLSDVDVTLLEGSGRLGGKIVTDHIGDLLIEHGPDSVFTSKPAAVDLAIELGMESELIEPLQHDFSILVNGRLFHVPRSLASLMPGASSALEKAEFFGASTRRRILKEAETPKGDGRDESIASFFRRRFGRKFSTLLAEPLLAGIHGGDPEKLSMKALYPSYLGLEQKKGSLTAPSDSPPPAPSATARKAGFLSLAGGMNSLVEKLGGALTRVSIHVGSEASRIEQTANGFRVRADGLEPIEADVLILAVPANVASCLVREISKSASENLLKIPHSSSAVINLAYSEGAFRKEVRGNGFLVPYTELCDITGSTWSSNKWAGRAPEGTILMRCFMGRHGGVNVDTLSDEELIERAISAMETILKPHEGPVFSMVKRWTKAMPQKVVGHTDLLASIEAGLDGLPIHLIGASYRSSGIPDCVREGREAAERISETA